MPSAHRRPLGVVSFYERQRERIATPACGLVRDDIYILGFFCILQILIYAKKAPCKGRLWQAANLLHKTIIYNPSKICYTIPQKGREMMLADCHMHMILDGSDWRAAIRRHSEKPDDAWIRTQLRTYQSLGFTYLRDGGDRWGAGSRAREFAPEYGITYRTPLAPLCKKGHYGAFIGLTYETFRDYAQLVQQHGKNGADFIKIMISGLMDFDRFGVLTDEGYPPSDIRELIHIAHEEGFSVMAHCNGARTAEAAAACGVDSIEHGAYLDADALHAMAENHTIWCPTLSTIGNLRGKGRFDETSVRSILDSAMENVSQFAHMGGLLAPGTDAGAWAVPHGSLTEFTLLQEALGLQCTEILIRGTAAVMEKF